MNTTVKPLWIQTLAERGCPDPWQVIYRQGGTDRFRWLQVYTYFFTREEADAEAAVLERAGYTARVVTKSAVDAGLPVTHSDGEDPAEFELRGTWYWRRSA